MASNLSTDGYDVVTPVLTKVMPSSLTPDSKLSHHTDVLSDAKHAKDAVTEGSTAEETKQVEESTGKKPGGSMTGEEDTVEAAIGSLAENTGIEINGTQYVKAAYGCWGDHITINGIAYVAGIAPAKYETAYSVLPPHQNAEDSDVPQEEINLANKSPFRGQPIMVHVGRHSYAVHPYFLTKSSIGRMQLDEDHEGNFSISLEEDPIQFERLLTYLYQGTWAPDSTSNCSQCNSWGYNDLVCSCWDNKQYMQLYALACKYEVHGLQTIIAPKLNLEDRVVMFCEAFKGAYKKCLENPTIRALFRRSLIPVFEHNLRQYSGVAHYDDWGVHKTLATQLAELASCGGDFAVDLVQTFADAKETAIGTAGNNQQTSGGDQGWESNEVSNNDGGGHHLPAESEVETGGNCWGNAVQNSDEVERPQEVTGRAPEATITRQDITKIHDRLLDLEVIAASEVSTSAIREEVNNVQGRLCGLENMVSNLQVDVARSAQSQRGVFPPTYLGTAQPYISPGLGPFIPLRQSTCCQPGLSHRGVGENKTSRDQGRVGQQGGRHEPISKPFGEVVDCNDYNNLDNGGW